MMISTEIIEWDVKNDNGPRQFRTGTWDVVRDLRSGMWGAAESQRKVRGKSGFHRGGCFTFVSSLGEIFACVVPD